MNETCEIPNCTQDVVFVFLRVEKLQLVKQATYCELHGTNFIDHYEKYKEEVVGGSTGRENGSTLELELLTYDYSQNSRCGLLLREAGSLRRLDIDTDPCETAALGRMLRREPIKRPLAYQSMDSILTGLRGQLIYTEIGECEDDELETAYAGKLHIQQKEADVVISVGAVDAVAMAVICKKPIVLSDVSH